MRAQWRGRSFGCICKKGGKLRQIHQNYIKHQAKLSSTRKAQ